jgi:hypothetical protein
MVNPMMKSTDPSGTTMVTLALITAQLLPAIAGALVSLKFVGPDLPLRHQLSSVAVGTVCAIYLAPAFISWFGLDGKALHESLHFLIGLFAVAVGREIFREIESGLVERIRDTFFSGGRR